MKKAAILLLIIFAISGIIFAVDRIATQADYINNDFLVFWMAGASNWEGIDPYSATEWLAARERYGAITMPEPEFLYPLPLAILLAPIGLFPVRQAFVIWGVVSIGLVILSIKLLFSIDTKNDQVNYLAYPLILFSPLFPPILLTLYLGQFSAFLFLFATLGIYFLAQKKDFWGGFFLAFFALKPNIGAPLLFLISLWLWARKKTRAFVGIFSSGMLLLIVGLLKDPNWILRFLSIIRHKADNTFGYSPTLWGLSGLFCQFERSCTILFGAISVFIFAILNIWLLRKNKDSKTPLEFGILLTISLLFAPYLWPYDQLLLLIPIIFALLTLLQRNTSPFKLLLIFLGISFFAITLGATANYLGHQHENLYVFLSLLVWMLSIWIFNLKDLPHRPRP